MMIIHFEGQAVYLVDEVEEELEKKNERIERLRKVLDRYGKHDMTCPMSNFTKKPCSCGLIQALKE